jgi:hypothetical protein
MEPKVTEESKETLAKLESHRVGKNPLTDDEITRIRKNFIEEDNRTWAKQLIYNFVVKSAVFLSALMSILGAFSLLKGWIKL